MPLKSRSFRTTSPKSAANEVDVSLRETKSATATFGLFTPSPVPVRNQSCARAGTAAAKARKANPYNTAHAAVLRQPAGLKVLILVSVFILVLRLYTQARAQNHI